MSYTRFDNNSVKTLLKQAYPNEVSTQDTKDFVMTLYSTWVEKAIAIANTDPNISFNDLSYYLRNRGAIDTKLGVNPKGGMFSSPRVNKLFQKEFNSCLENNQQPSDFLSYISDKFIKPNTLISNATEEIRTNRGNTLLPGFDIKKGELQHAGEYYAGQLSTEIQKAQTRLRNTARNSKAFLQQRSQDIQNTSLLLEKEHIKSFLSN